MINTVMVDGAGRVRHFSGYRMKITIGWHFGVAKEIVNKLK